MFAAAQAGNVSAMTWLKDQGLGVNDRDEEGRTPMFLAAWWGDLPAMAWLKEQGADLNARDKQGQTPLSAARNDKTKQWLRDNGAQE